MMEGEWINEPCEEKNSSAYFIVTYCQFIEAKHYLDTALVNRHYTCNKASNFLAQQFKALHPVPQQ